MNEAKVRQVEYATWKVIRTTDPYIFRGINTTDSITFDIIKYPEMGKMELKFDSAIYYLHKIR
jgi:hypothetical protein